MRKHAPKRYVRLVNRKVSRYYRWLKRWYYAYLVRVKLAEREMGGELHAC